MASQEASSGDQNTMPVSQASFFSPFHPYSYPLLYLTNPALLPA